MRLLIVVPGIPKPKGSLRHIGRGRLIEQVAGSAPWRERVRWAARTVLNRDHTETGWEPGHPGPVCVSALLCFPPRKRAPKTWPMWPITRATGDVDKLARNLLDALVDAAVMADDAQVVDLHISKRYYAGLIEHLDGPGAVIDVRRAGDAA